MRGHREVGPRKMPTADPREVQSFLPFLLCGLWAMLFAAAPKPVNAAHLIWLGDLPGGTFDSEALGLSDDGSTVVGSSDAASGREAFRWTVSTGIAGLGDLAGGAFESEAWSTSADGTVVVGYSISTIGRQPFKWTPEQQMTGFGGQGIATDLSSTASVVVGFAPFNMSTEGFRGAQGQPFAGLGDLAGGIFESAAFATSSGGDVVVGFSNGILGNEAFRWLLGVGMFGIGDLSGGPFSSVANGVSASGSVVVGRSASSSGFEAFRWTNSSGMVGLGDLQGGSFDSSALDVSEDGRVVVGYGHSSEGQQATIWTPESGMIPFTEFLTAFGIETGTRTLESARRVSSDGFYVAGTGRNESGDREAWIAYVPEASSLSGQVVAILAIAILSRYRRPALESVGNVRRMRRLVPRPRMAIHPKPTHRHPTSTPTGMIAALARSTRRPCLAIAVIGTAPEP